MLCLCGETSVREAIADLLVVMRFLFGEVSSFSWCIEYAALFYYYIFITGTSI